MFGRPPITLMFNKDKTSRADHVQLGRSARKRVLESALEVALVQNLDRGVILPSFKSSRNSYVPVHGSIYPIQLTPTWRQCIMAESLADQESGS